MLSLYGRVRYTENAVITLLTFWSFNVSLCCKRLQECLEKEPKQNTCLQKCSPSDWYRAGFMSSSSLKRNQTESWLENRKCENISLRMLHLVILSIFPQKEYLLLRMWAPQGQPCWFTLNQRKTEKIWHVMCLILSPYIQALLMMSIVVFWQLQFLTSRTKNQGKKCCMYIIYSIPINTFVLPFASISLVIILWLSFPFKQRLCLLVGFDRDFCGKQTISTLIRFWIRYIKSILLSFLRSNAWLMVAALMWLTGL